MAVRKVQSPERREQSRCDERMQQLGWTVIKIALRIPKVVLQTKGIPDRKYYKGNKTFWFECKAEGGKQSPEQRAFQEMCTQAGEFYVIGGMKELGVFLGIEMESAMLTEEEGNELIALRRKWNGVKRAESGFVTSPPFDPEH